MNILVLDNYDSFTYNAVDLLRRVTPDHAVIDVFRNDEITLDAVGKYDNILISPGPGVPDEAGITKDVIKTYGSHKSILGICLGCQAIAEVYGGKLINLNEVYHGVATAVLVTDKNDRLMTKMPSKFTAGRYHSWVVDEASLPETVKVSSKDEAGKVMAIYHTEYDVRGVQFHPESIMTEAGMELMSNWINFNSQS